MWKAREVREDQEPPGYLSAAYAASLADFGVPRPLPRARGWLLERAIDDASRDLCGCYPLFCCMSWSALRSDLAALERRFVSVTVVTDPFAEAGAEELRELFPDLCVFYKNHYIADLSRPPESYVAGQHRRKARKAIAQGVRVVIQSEADKWLSEWCRLYAHLMERHGIRGMARFSPQAFRMQFQVPGFVAAAAFVGNQVAGMLLWFVQGGVAYYHLGASSSTGYAQEVSFLLFWESYRRLPEHGARWAALGSGAGVQASSAGLSRFKEGWATGTRPVYLCGRIFDPERYQSLSLARGRVEGAYFPAYRAAELMP